MKYEIYQLKEDTMEQVKLRFMASDQAAQLGGIHRENYRRVYGGEIPSVPEVGRMLLRLFALFNGSNRPVDFLWPQHERVRYRAAHRGWCIQLVVLRPLRLDGTE